MGVVFGVRGAVVEGRERVIRATCPCCSGNALFGPSPDPDCDRCLGYGGDERLEVEYWSRWGRCNLSLNLGTARVVCGWLGGEAYGSMAPDEVRRRLATVNPSEGQVRPRELRGVYVDQNGVGNSVRCLDMGVEDWRLVEVHRTLLGLCDLAEQQGSEITWG